MVKLTISLLSNFPIDYRDEVNTFRNESEAKILVPVSGPSGEVKLYKILKIVQQLKV